MLALVLVVAGQSCGHDERTAPAAPPWSPAAPGWTSALDALLAGVFAADEPGGVVLVADEGRAVYRRAFGLADLDTGEPLRPDSVLAVGSITKQFAAAAILVLVGDGRLALGDDVRDYLPEAPTQGRAVTIDQLLTHTSGLPTLIDDEGFEDWAAIDRSLGEIVAATEGMRLHFEPGQGFAYTDSGYILLGAVVERVSGRPFAEFLDERVLGPLGLHDTVMGSDPRLVARVASRRARGYTVRDGVIGPPDPLSFSVPHAAGALLSTADDLLRWHVGVAEGEVVPPELVERAWAARVLPDGTPVGYGYGWKLCSIDGHRTIEHGGWINGYTGVAVHLPDDGLGAIVLLNRDDGDPGAIARRALRLVLTGSPEMPVVKLTIEQRAALVGDYRFPDGSLRLIRDQDGVLTSQRDGGEVLKLLPLSPTELSFEFGEGSVVLQFELQSPAHAETDAPRAVIVRSMLNCEPRDVAVRQP